MEIRTLESVGIQTVESGIKTAKQKITTTEERAEEALLNSTMGEEENDDSFDQDRRNKKGFLLEKEVRVLRRKVV